MDDISAYHLLVPGSGFGEVPHFEGSDEDMDTSHFFAANFCLTLKSLNLSRQPEAPLPDSHY